MLQQSPFARASRFALSAGPLSNSPADGALSFALLLALGTSHGLPHNESRLVAAIFVGLGAVYLLSRSLAVVWLATFAATLVQRFQPSDPWPDQTFVQLSSLASLLSGRGIFDPANGIGVSWAVYLPMADLLAAFPVWFVGAKFWSFFQVLVPLLYSLPFWVSPSQVTFRLFLGLTAFVPFAALTARGSTLEISVAALFAGFWLLLRGRYLPLAGALLGYAALLRQPILFIVPFVALALWRLRAERALRAFAAVLVFGGLVHVARNPAGFVAATFSVWPDFADQWFHKLGTRGNYSITNLLLALGDEHALDRSRQPLYLLLILVAIAGLLAYAWRRRTVESAVVGAIAAVLLVHLLSRGFVLYHYVVAAMMPALAFAGLERGRALPPAAPPAAFPGRLLAAVVGGAIALLVATPLVLAAVGEVRSWRAPEGRPVRVASLSQGLRDGSWLLERREPPQPLNLDSREALEMELAEPAIPRELVLVGTPIPPRLIAGATLVFPTTLEVAGFLRSGLVEGSIDGEAWMRLARFRTWVHPSFYSTRIDLDSGGRPVRYLRLRDGATWWGQSEWLLGGVEVRGDPPPAGAAAN